MSSSISDTTLRINGRAIADLLEPSSGLGPVLQAASFDVNAIKAKLSAVDATPTSSTLSNLSEGLC